MKKILLLLFGVVFITAMAMAQRTITGKVTDDKGNPIANVSILVKGTTVGTTTKADGSYSITVPANGKTLVISAVGLVSKEMAIGNNSTLSATLTAEDKSLDEVVVVAYGTVKKKDFTGASNKIDGKAIANRPLTNVTSALVGAAPGVQTNAGTGQPGSAPSVRIRGFGSISASNDPLYVVDGIPFSASIANLNVNDIENITVLKDAASTALYGARAANGVVMITTKKGKKGKNQISVSLSGGSSSRAIPEYERVNVYDYYPIMWEGLRNSLAYRATNPQPLATANQNATSGIFAQLRYNPFNVANNSIVGLDGKLNPNAQLVYNPDDLDWEKSISRNGARTDVAINMSGGQDKMDYFFSLGYLTDKAFIIRSDYNRYNARLNLNAQMTPWFKSGINLAGTFIRSNQASATGGTAFVNPFNFTRNIGSIYPIYAYNTAFPGQYITDINGNKIYDIGNNTVPGLVRPGGASAGRHITQETELNQEYFRRNVWNGRTYGEFTFLKDFKLTMNVGVDVTNRVDYDYDNAIVGDGAPSGRSQKTYQAVTSYNLNQLLNYKKKVKASNFEVLLGHENYDYKDDNLSGFRTTQTVAGNIELNNFASITSLTSEANEYRVEGYFARVNYDYDNRFYLSASYRRDGSSKFSKENRWGNFAAGSVMWRLDNEKFIKNVSWINNLRIRSSYGETGNDGGIGFYASQALYSLGFNNASEPGLIRGSLGNNSLQWEKNTQFDIALEYGIFKNRISGTIEYFKRESDNLLFSVPLPLSSGVLSVDQNVGSMYNKGWEINLAIDIVRTKSFNWSTNFNWTSFKNRITKMPDGQPEIVSGTKKLAVGRSLYDYWRRVWYGVDPANGAALYKAIALTNPATDFVNAKGDLVTTNINNGMFEYTGSSIPDYYGSITNTFSFNGIELSALLTFQKGGKVYDATWAGLMNSGTYGQAYSTDILRRWQKPGDVTDVPRMDVGQTANFSGASSRWLTDASFVNIRNISVSYSLPAALTKQFKIQNARFFITGENLKLFSKRDGMNVEESFTGVTSNEFVPARIITAGLNITL